MKPRLAVFAATSGHSGVDRVFGNLVHEFARRGIQVDLLHIGGHGPYIPDTPENLVRIDLGCSHVNTSLFPLVRYLKDRRPAALLCDKDKVNRTALWARKLSGQRMRVAVRVGTTVSVNLARRKRMARWLQILSIRYLYRWAEEIIMPSQGAADDLAEIGRFPADRIRVIPNPIIAPHVFRMADEAVAHPWLDENSGFPVILGVGELSPRKDFATLIKAFAMLRQLRSCRLMILGEGRERENLLALADELGVASDIAFPGFVENPYAYMQKAAMVVLSSRWEGFGNILAEALGLGRPVVSTDCPNGPREILGGGRFGKLVPVGDAPSMQRAIQETLEAPPAANVLKKAARPYQIENSADMYLNALGLASANCRTPERHGSACCGHTSFRGRYNNI